MATPAATITRVQTGSAEERRDVVQAARDVFAREGWTHTTAEDIAARAGVAPETVEHYFRDKERLLLSVLLESAAQVAAALTVAAEEHLVEITDLERDLAALGRAWLAPLTDFPEHFAIIRHIGAEIGRLPAGLLEMWQSAGPRQARRELGRRLERLAELGLLDITDADHAAERFIQLVTGGVVQRSFHGACPLPEFETDTLVGRGVADFIRLFSPAAPR
ncbi:TetR/AcrR family transcriptional regulator [Streptomyces sp. NPDC014846]|jgi:AcrR family transcriptional regulator|uniref:TetR/AcrR family transcriptional regulator n=1 Tax=unclassified Streptomyces TaxID=2593676 RepID=UPI0036FBA079